MAEQRCGTCKWRDGDKNDYRAPVERLRAEVERLRMDKAIAFQNLEEGNLNIVRLHLQPRDHAR